VLRLDLPHVSLAALSWGPDDGPLALLLHGFPDTAHTWRHLGPALAEDGWRVVAPFTRGYAPSEVANDGSGHVAALVSDAVATHEVLGADERAVVVGHDWGAITANALAAHDESPFRRVVALAVPPFPSLRGARMLRALPRQLRNSWYIAYHQLPVLPERLLEREAARLWRDWSPGYDASEDLPHVLAAVAEPDHRRAVIGYYRDLVRPSRPPRHYRQWQGAEMRMPQVPLLYAHGADDGCLDARLAAQVATSALPEGSEVHLVTGAGHFLHLERPDEVARLVREFLRRSGEPASG
jgi:pimeloyl-ACP methyl ester carboxylesterase